MTPFHHRSKAPGALTFRPPQRRVPGGEGKYQKVLADIGSKYVTVFDPLDGSSNVDANIPTGTIFGVYEEAESMENCVLDGAARPPRRPFRPRSRHV